MWQNIDFQSGWVEEKKRPYTFDIFKIWKKRHFGGNENSVIHKRKKVLVEK